MEILAGIHQLKVPIPDNPLGYLNSYLLQGTDGWLMIDTGWNVDYAFESLKQQLKDIDLSLEQITQIVITHMHFDHYGLTRRIKAVSSATVAYHRIEKETLEAMMQSEKQIWDQGREMMLSNGVPPSKPGEARPAHLAAARDSMVWPDRVLEDGDQLSTGIFNLTVMLTPGHSRGHICLYEPENKLLFSGDHILPIITPNISFNLFSGPDPLTDFTQSLAYVNDRDVKKVFPAHEHIFDDLPARVQDILVHHDNRNAVIRNTIDDGPLTAYEIASRIPWDVPDTTWETMLTIDKRSATLETLAHLEYMKGEGKVTSSTDNGLIRYQQV